VVKDIANPQVEMRKVSSEVALGSETAAEADLCSWVGVSGELTFGRVPMGLTSALWQGEK